MATTKMHRVKMVVEFTFGFEDEVGLLPPYAENKLSTKKQILQELIKELKRDGLSDFVNQSNIKPKTKLKSMTIVNKK